MGNTGSRGRGRGRGRGKRPSTPTGQAQPGLKSEGTLNCMYVLISSLPTVQFLITCSVRKWRGRLVYYVHNVNVYLGKTELARK